MKFYGSNTINSSKKIHNERAKYLFEAYQEAYEKFTKNKTLSETRLYGLIDLDGYPIEPKEDYLVTVNTTLSKDTFNKVLPFFSDQLNDLEKYMSRIPFLKQNIGSRWLTNIQVYKSYDSPSEKYTKYMIDVVTDYIDNGINNKETNIGKKIPSNMVADYNSFVKYFLLFCEYKYLNNPLTYSGWMLSNKSSIYNSGVGVSIAPIETSEDNPKVTELINTPEFECLFGACKKVGLSVDLWNPSVVMIDFASPQTISYFLNSFPFSNSLEEVFSTYYNKCYNKDIILLNNILIYIYNKFSNNQKYDIKFNDTCLKTTWKFIQRQPTNLSTFDNEIEKYLKLKSIEFPVFNRRDLKDLEKKSKKIEILFDKLTAMDYINKAYQNIFYNQKYSLTQLYNEFIKQQETKQKQLGQNIYGGTNEQTNNFSSY